MSLLGVWREDVDAAIRRDPALASRADASFNSPGLHAIWVYRLTHALWNRGHRMPARLFATLARMFTGVEIHPAARIGKRFFIDHATGTVIGETAIIGDDVLMYHQVTLGARGNRKGERHPIIGDRVMIGAGAKILGRVRVGDGARVGANSVVLDDVPEGATVTGIAAQVKSFHPPDDPAIMI